MTELEQLSFEAALNELEQVVEKLEEGSQSLDETVALYQRGHGLAKHCQGLLDSVELRVKQLVSDAEGGGTTVPFDPDAQT